MPVELTLSLRPEDAKRLMQAFKDGKLAEFGILEIILPDPDVPGKKWVGTEAERRQELKQDDVPPLG